MKKNKLAKIFLALGLGIATATSSVTMVACGDKEQQEQEQTYTVTFALGYAGATGAPKAQTVKNGAKADEPTEPTRDGYTFDGWYTSDGTKWTFGSDTVTGNLNLVAHWTANTPSGGGSGNEGTGGTGGGTGNEGTGGTGGGTGNEGTGGTGGSTGNEGTGGTGGSTGNEGTGGTGGGTGNEGTGGTGGGTGNEGTGGTGGGTGNEGTGGTGGNQGTTPGESVKTDTVVDVDFTADGVFTETDPLSATAFGALGDKVKGLTLHATGDEKLRLQGSKTADKIMGLNLNGTATLENHSLSFTVPKAGKVVVTVSYTNSNNGRYVELFVNKENTKQVIATAMNHVTKGTGSPNLVTCAMTVWTTADNTEIFLGSANLGIEINSVKVESTYNIDGTALAPTFTSLTVTKETKAYKLVNASVQVTTDDIIALTEGNAMVPAGWTSATKIYSDQSCTTEASLSVTAAGTYYLRVEATNGTDTVKSNTVDITVSNPANSDLVTNGVITKMIGSGESTTTISASDITLKVGDVELDATVWSIGYKVRATSGDSDEAGTDSWSLAVGTYTMTVTATKGAVTLTGTITINVRAYEAVSNYSVTYKYDGSTDNYLNATWDNGLVGNIVIDESGADDATTSRQKSGEGFSATKYKLLENSKNIKITIPAGAENVTITVYTSHTNGSTNRTLYLSTTVGDYNATNKVSVNGSAENGTLHKLEATGLAAGDYYLYAGTTGGMHIYGIVISYSVNNAA